MENKFMISSLLEKLMIYPVNKDNKKEKGIQLKIQGNDRLIIEASPDELIDLADLLVSLALSGENRGQHWHIDEHSMVSDNSEISELIVMRNDE